MPECCSLPRGGECHCARCHQTFANLAQFDAHQDVDYKRSPAVLCAWPEDRGLVKDARGIWRTREAVLANARSAARMASQRRKGDK